MTLSFDFIQTGDKVTTHFNGTRLSTLQADKLLAALTKERGSLPTGVLPPVVRWMSPSRRFVIFERPPMMQTISFAGVAKGKIDTKTRFREFALPLPWTVYVFHFSELMQAYELYLFFSMKSITSDDDILLMPPLVNVESTGKFCVPSLPGFGNPEFANKSIGDGINQAYAQIWDSNFNTDIVSNIAWFYKTKRPTALWQRMVELNKGQVMTGSAARLFQAWSTFELTEVLQWKDMLHGYLFWPDGNEGATTVGNVIKLLTMKEGEFNSQNLINSFVRLANRADLK